MTTERTKILQNSLEKTLELLSKNLISRSEWGVIDFSNAANDINRTSNILKSLNNLPLELLPDEALNNILQTINQIIPILGQMDSFKITSGNPTGTRDQIQESLHKKIDQLYSYGAVWIPFLAYQKGDMSENISQLNSTLNQAQKLIEKTKNDIENSKTEINQIIIATREASASAGAAVFTIDFENESIEQEKSAKKWLIATGIGVLTTLISAILMWAYAVSNTSAKLSNSQIIQTIAAKLVILTMLVTGTMWIARQYRALKHLSTLNRHRSLSLRTLKAFSAAASDEQTKNAVLIEVTRAVFQANHTGYLDGHNGEESSTKIIEIAKVLSSKSSN